MPSSARFGADWRLRVWVARIAGSDWRGLCHPPRLIPQVRRVRRPMEIGKACLMRSAKAKAALGVVTTHILLAVPIRVALNMVPVTLTRTILRQAV